MFRLVTTHTTKSTLNVNHIRCTCRFTTSTRSLAAPPNSFTTRPGPPALDRAAQREFEELQRRVNAPASKPAPGTAAAAATTSAETTAVQDNKVDEERLTMHPDLRKTPAPAFEGETNPTTGEVGGPKREPLVHGKQTTPSVAK